MYCTRHLFFFCLFFSAYNDLKIAEEDNLTYDGNTLVMKNGYMTSTTYGRLHDLVDHISLDPCGIKCNFHDVYSICNLSSPLDLPFFLPGDSGSAVYLIDENGECNEALGIGFGIMHDDENRTLYTYVCSIRTIVDAFDIDATAN